MDWQSIAAILVPILTVMGWIWSRIDRKFDKLESKFDSRLDSVDTKLDKLESKFESRFDKVERDLIEIRTSLNRMEGAFYSKDCCMLKDDKLKKVE